VLPQFRAQDGLCPVPGAGVRQDGSVDVVGAAVRLIFGPVGLVIGLSLVVYLNGVLNDRLDAWLGRITGWSAWAERVRLVERQLSHPALWKATEYGSAAAMGLTAIGCAIRLHPQDPWERHDGVVVLGIALVLWLVVGAVGIRWWRVSGADADVTASRAP
jgi:hypothetical protein